MNPLFQDWSREIDFLAAPPLDHDVFSPELSWEWHCMFYAAPDWVKDLSRSWDMEEVLGAWKRKGDYSPDLFWFAAPVAGFSKGFFGLSREDQNMLIRFWSDQLGNSIKPLPFLYMVKFVGCIEEVFQDFDRYMRVLREYEWHPLVAEFFWGITYRSSRGWSYMAQEAAGSSFVDCCAAVSEGLEGSVPTWGNLLPAIEQEEVVGGDILPPTEVLHTRWLAAYRGFDPSGGSDGLSEVDLVNWFVRMVDFEMYEAVLPRSWAIERPGRAGIGGKHMLTTDDGKPEIATAIVGLAVDPLHSRPIGLWEGDGYTTVMMDCNRGVKGVFLDSNQGELRKNLHPYFWGEGFPYGYYEVVGWPHFVGVVAGRPKPEVGVVDLSQEIARMVARKTGLPYLGRR